jgi:hypothetical protein
MLEAGRRRVAGDGEERRRRDWDRPAWGKGMKLMGGARMAVTWEREKASLLECAKSKEIHLLANTPRLLGPNGLSVDTTSYGAKRASTGEAGLDGPKSEENSFLNKNWIFEYTKTLEMCTRKFRRNFDMRIFPKIFYAIQVF